MCRVVRQHEHVKQEYRAIALPAPHNVANAIDVPMRLTCQVAAPSLTTASAITTPAAAPLASGSQSPAAPHAPADPEAKP